VGTNLPFGGGEGLEDLAGVCCDRLAFEVLGDVSDRPSCILGEQVQQLGRRWGEPLDSELIVEEDRGEIGGRSGDWRGRR